MNLDQIGIFLDRDGTVNTEIDYLSRPEDLVLIPHAAKSIRQANEFGVKVFIVTNQSGIARGLFTEEALTEVHTQLDRELSRDGARIDRIYYCPHHPEYGTPPYRRDCTCRKPNIGMLKKAEEEFGIRLQDSYVVGDRCIDIQLGVRAGCGTVLVLTGYGAKEKTECLRTQRVDYVATDIFHAWTFIKDSLEKRFAASHVL
jgi:D-glycero-D-manno-heptose 1,7-bisphosphate phosphatase